MAKIIENISKEELEKIRRQWSPEFNKWYFSVVDTIGVVTDSTDARNYWKVLKNRLKNTQNKLVTECNQLKMRSVDGKFYMTDALDARTLLILINLISPSNVSTFQEYFLNLKNFENESYPQLQGLQSEEIENELLFDGYHEGEYIFVVAMVAGMSPQNILVFATTETLTIEGDRKPPLLGGEGRGEVEVQELTFGKFSRTINLPEEIESDNVSATLSRGLLKIKLKKINKLARKRIEIKTL